MHGLNNFSLTLGHLLNPSWVARKLGTNDWMTNAYIFVIYLSFVGYSLQDQVKELAEK